MSGQRGEAEAIMFVPPAGNDSTAPGNLAQKNLSFTVTGTSTAAKATGAGTITGQSGVVCCTVSASVAFHIRFGLAAVAAATTSDMYFPAGSYSFTCRSGIESHFRIIKATGESDGVGSAYRSSP